MNNLILKTIKVDGKVIPVTDSRVVAENTGIRHTDLLRKIRGYECVLLNAKLRSADFFIEDSYKDSTGKENKCYQLTKQGCEMVANKMTGKKGILFTATYVQAFNDMQEQLKNGQPKSSLDLLELQVKALKEVKGEVEGVKTELQEFKEDLPLLGSEPEELQAVVRKIGTRALGGYKSPAYCDKSISKKVYKSVWKYIKDQFNVNTYKAIKRKYLDKAKEIAESYEAPFYLREEIDMLNNQSKLDV